MNETTNAVTKTDDKVMEFVPFGAEDKIKLSVGIIQNLVAVKTKSGKTCSANDAIKFMMMCQARRLNPFEGDAYLIGYDGKEGPTFSLITAHQAFLKRAEINPEYDGMKSGVILKDKDTGEVTEREGDFYDPDNDDVVGGWATVFFKHRSNPMHKKVRLSRFQKSWGIWQDDPAGMICKCAEADALRSSFPTMLGGLYMREELEPEKAKFSAPIFTEPVKEAPPKESKPVVEVAAEPEPAPEPEPPPPPAKDGLNKVKAIVGFLKQAGFTEGNLIAYLWALKGVIPPEVKKLSECSEDVIDMVYSDHGEIIQRMKGDL